MFLQPIKVKNFAVSKKVHGLGYRYGGRQLSTYANDKPDDVFHVIGVSSIKEGAVGYDFEDGYSFEATNSHKVYIVAKSIGRRYKVLPQDIELLEV